MASLQLQEVPRDIKGYERYQVIALSRNGINKSTISTYTGCSLEIVCRWGERTGITDAPRSGRPLVYNEEIQLKLIAFYCQTTPLPDCGRWTLRWAEKYLKEDSSLVGTPPSHSTIGRILKTHTLKPHLSKYFLHITDPDFFPKMENIIPLYLDPPKHLYCFDECPGIQILRRIAPDLRTDEMKIRLEEFEYIRNGTMDVFAFLHVQTGKIFSKCRADHKTQTLLDVFTQHLQTLPVDEEIHYIMDNLASHSSYEMCTLIAKSCRIECPSEKELDSAVKRREWLQSEDKRIVFHYTPFHGSWLNMVEIWFGILNQKCLKESFDSPGAIYKAIYDFIIEWNDLLAHPFKWTYDGQGLHQKAVDRFLAILGNSVEKLEIRFMTKQFSLMANLIEHNWNKVKISSWMKLNDLINSELDQFLNVIFVEDGPKRKEKAEIALWNLMEALSVRIDYLTTQVA